MKSSERNAWLFLAPALLLLAVFTFWPLLFGGFIAFTRYDLVSPPQWVGLDNFRDLLDDAVFWQAMANSLKYLLVVPAIQLSGIALAVLANRSLPGIRLFRAALYLPVVTTVSVVGIMWNWMYADYGVLNSALHWLKLLAAERDIGFLSDDSLALYSVMFVTWWRGLGYYMVLYLAGLQSIPAEMQEAARLDGANAWQRFWRITVPMLKPTILFCSLISTLDALKAFEEVLVMTRGAPLNSTYTVLYYAFHQGFNQLDFGRGAAAGLTLALVCLLLAWLNFKLIRADHR
ncbi:sugar ABC transporter permease [Chromobacterium subtsugae]|uniref:Sugar ABC transporter permease n=1 Tax=Chromobacterium subtsugae TaxID=251747 RepID=A0ABS7FBY5_9NEIS|nr:MULTISPECIES: sugar ABC transporter permease [Chromobacterium]KUM03075.1 lactose ABC transporter permease [Chromobacterium subtsugae]KZE86787.1 lactose ABC transporter permease [Chromobacterium sp. F49]MBW7568544.1 sugar ABC transporter permease [Chromobacterium subtsugae]MBW8287579.1 sugar ABC transporter permease [Chromobacterium subtsugae]OBU84666.1 lactose ABC transporter permease [Chromobacterium subtsugae]